MNDDDGDDGGDGDCGGGGAGGGCGTLGVKGTTVGAIIIAQVPWSLCAKGTTEQE